MFPNISIHAQPNTMLKSLNNNTSPFSMDNLLSKIPPSASSPDEERENPSPNDVNRSSPIDRRELVLGFGGCFKSRMCSNCGNADCTSIQCRMELRSNDDGLKELKDTKPVLKFSVSAILGTENQARNVQNGKSIFMSIKSLILIIETTPKMTTKVNVPKFHGILK